MSKSPTQTGTNTTTTTNAPPGYVQEAQAALLAMGLGLNSPFLGSTANYALAGFVPDQTQAFELARSAAQGAFSNAPLQVGQFGNTQMSPASVAAPPTVSAATMGPAAQATAAQATAAIAEAAQLGPAAMMEAIKANAHLLGPAAQAAVQQLTSADIESFFNPYQRDVTDATTRQLEDANSRQLAAIRARQGAEGSYGGNRGALEETEQNRNFGNTLASTIAQLNQADWNNAATLGAGNAQLRQQTTLANTAAQNQFTMANTAAQNQFELANQSWENQAGLANQAATNSFTQLQAQLIQQANLANAQNQTQVSIGNANNSTQVSIGNAASQNQMAALQAQLAQQAALANAANQQQANIANAGYQQQAGMFNATQPLAVASLQNQMNQTSWQEQMQALQALLTTGNQQQQFAQQALNVPFTALQNFAGLVPSQYGSSGTSSQPIYGPSTLQTIASLAPLGIAAGAAFSDKTMKKDIDKLGKDPETGLDFYSWRYKGASADSPKNIGPMAQDVEKKYPGSTARVGGKLAIKSSARQMLGI